MLSWNLSEAAQNEKDTYSHTQANAETDSLLSQQHKVVVQEVHDPYT